MYPILGFTVALFLTIVLIPLLMRYAPVLGLLDEPGDRKVHAVAIPRCGGLAIATGFFVAATIWLPWERQSISLLASALIIMTFGLHDDRKNLSYQWKFFGQILAIAMLMYGGILIERLPFCDIDISLPWISYPLTFLFLLGAVNAVNLTDGLDGLAAGTTLLSLCLLAVFAYQTGQSSVVLLSLSVAGALVGFLRYNTHPAQVFMGDTGSQFVGLITASLAIMVTQSKHSAFSPLLPLLVLGLPILDTFTVMCIRLYSRSSPFAADKNHIHHQLMALGLRHYEAVALIYLLQIVMVVSAYWLRFQADWLIALFYLVFAGILLSALYFAHSRQITFRGVNPFARADERRNQILRRMDWYYHHSTQVLQFVLAAFFLQAFIYVEGISAGETRFAMWVATGLLLVAILFQRSPQLGGRIVGYLSSVTVVYLLAVTDTAGYTHWWVDGYLLMIIALLLLAIRMTRKSEFRLDTRDMLVLFLVVVLPQLPIGTINEVSLGWFTLRLAILLYTCEFLLSKPQFNYWFYNAAAIVGLLLIGWFG